MPTTKPKTEPNENMTLWNQVCKTDPATTKRVEQRGGFTAICAQSQLKRATELWGPFGNKWSVTNCQYTPFRDASGNIVSVLFTAMLNTPDGCQAISSDILFQTKKGVAEDYAKKLYTDALTKGLSRMGFNADVFMGKFDDNKYVQAVAREFAAEREEERPKTVADRLADSNKKIVKRLQYLGAQKWDGFGADDRRMASINLHLGDEGLKCGDVEKMEAYAEHLKQYCLLAKAGKEKPNGATESK